MARLLRGPPAVAVVGSAKAISQPCQDDDREEAPRRRRHLAWTAAADASGGTQRSPGETPCAPLQTQRLEEWSFNWSSTALCAPRDARGLPKPGAGNSAEFADPSFITLTASSRALSADVPRCRDTEAYDFASALSFLPHGLSLAATSGPSVALRCNTSVAPSPERGGRPGGRALAVRVREPAAGGGGTSKRTAAPFPHLPRAAARGGGAPHACAARQRRGAVRRLRSRVRIRR